jgi:hypothetical protein
MRTVAIRVVDADFAQQMALMRDWLDRQCSEPTRFIYKQANDEVVVSVEFPNEGDAEAFAIRFLRQEHPDHQNGGRATQVGLRFAPS